MAMLCECDFYFSENQRSFPDAEAGEDGGEDVGGGDGAGDGGEVVEGFAEILSNEVGGDGGAEPGRVREMEWLAFSRDS